MWPDFCRASSASIDILTWIALPSSVAAPSVAGHIRSALAPGTPSGNHRHGPVIADRERDLVHAGPRVEDLLHVRFGKALAGSQPGDESAGERRGREPAEIERDERVRGRIGESPVDAGGKDRG